MLSTHANIFNEIELLTYHREEALEWSVNLLSIVGPNSDGRCLSQRAKVIGWLHLVLGCPWNSPDKMHDPLLKIKNHFKKINKSHQPNSFFFFKQVWSKAGQERRNSLPIGNYTTSERWAVVSSPTHKHNPSQKQKSILKQKKKKKENWKETQLLRCQP